MGENRRIYRARAESWGLGISGTEKEQVAVQFAVLTEGADLQTATWYGYFTEGTFDRTIESLRYCGWTGDLLSDLSGLDANEVDLVIEDEEYEGKVSPKVQWVNKPGGLAVKTPLQGEDAARFAAAMQGRIRALDAARGKKPAARTERRAPTQQSNRAAANGGPRYAEAPRGAQGGDFRDVPPPGDDDIPF